MYLSAWNDPAAVKPGGLAQRTLQQHSPGLVSGRWVLICTITCCVGTLSHYSSTILQH
jgi:hypothetical protein